MRRILRTRSLAALAALVAAAATLLPASADDAVPFDSGTEIECLDAVPHPSVDPLGGPRVLRLAVALDGVGVTAAHSVMNHVKTLFARSLPAGPDIEVKIVSMHGHEFTHRQIGAFVDDPSPSDRSLMSELMLHYRRDHPELARDHVHLLTSKDIHDAGDTSIAGVANCIGSAGNAALSYSIGEVLLRPVRFLGLTMLADVNGKIAAHEIAHGLGAHHHYANCVQPVPDAATARRTDVCTLMFNDIGFAALRLSPLEVLSMRGTAERHLRPAR